MTDEDCRIYTILDAMLLHQAIPSEEMLQHHAVKALSELRASLTAVSAEKADLEEVLADSRRLTRELDVALCGEENAAEQASLCDLLGPAAQVRAKAQVMHDLHDSLGVAWGDDPYARIAELKAAELSLAEVSRRLAQVSEHVEKLTRYASNGEVIHYRGDYGEYVLRAEVLALCAPTNTE